MIDVHSPETRIHSIFETLHPAAIITDNEWLPLAKKLAGASVAEIDHISTKTLCSGRSTGIT